MRDSTLKLRNLITQMRWDEPNKDNICYFDTFTQTLSLFKHCVCSRKTFRIFSRGPRVLYHYLIFYQRDKCKGSYIMDRQIWISLSFFFFSIFLFNICFKQPNSGRQYGTHKRIKHVQAWLYFFDALEFRNRNKINLYNQ